MALIGSINSSNDFGFKNRIINGAMMIDQRNAGSSVTVSTSVNTFPVDRMITLASGATATAQRVAGTGAYAYDLQYTGAASVTASYLFQRIESFNCLDLVSKSVTFQVQLSSTTVTSVAVGLYSAGSTDDFSAPVSISTTTFTITSTPTIYTWTVNTGANAANGLQIQLNFGAFTSGTTRISGMQLEKGSTATAFDYRSFGTELSLCQRYYYQISYGTSAGTSVHGYARSSTQAYFNISNPSIMRISPAVAFTGTAPAFNDGASNSTGMTSPGILASNTKDNAFYAGMTGSTAYRPGTLFGGSGGAGVTTFSAEL